MNKTSIEWTDFTWNPIRARRKSTGKTGTFCTRISPGCQHCYASTINKRFGTGAEFTVPNLADHDFYISSGILEEPLHRKKPARIFVGDMFDLFHEAIPAEQIKMVLNVAVAAKQHTFQFLTKRPKRMKRILDAYVSRESRYPWLMPQHMQFGTSIESQKYANERIDVLTETPAAVRFLSVEPQLEEINLNLDGLAILLDALHDAPGDPGWIHWVICGGESGPGARPFNLAWARSIRDQCKAEDVAFFMKQLGSRPQVHSCRDEKCTHPDCGMEDLKLKDRKGGDMSEWPEDLRIREFPR